MKTENKCKNRYANILACKYAFIDQARSLRFRDTFTPLWLCECKFITSSAYYSASLFYFIFCLFGFLLWRFICLFGYCTGCKLYMSKFKDSRIRTQKLKPSLTKSLSRYIKTSQFLRNNRPVYLITKADGACITRGPITGYWLQNLREFLEVFQQRILI